MIPTLLPGKSILIIDDDADLGELLETVLRGNGYFVRLASSGITGLALAYEMKPDLILLDWQMPEMDGEKVLEILAARDSLKSVPVVLMSANNWITSPHAVHARTRLKKPFDIQHLLERVAALTSGVSEAV